MHKWKLMLWCCCLPFAFVQGQSNQFPCAKLADVRLLIQKGQNNDAANALNKLEFKSPLCVAEYNFLKGVIKLNAFEEELAQKHFNSAFQTFKQQSHKVGMVRAAHQLALLAMDQGEQDKAATYLDEVLEFKSALLETGLFHEVLDVRAILWSEQGDRKSATKLLKTAINHTSPLNDTTAYIQLLNQIATHHQVAGQIDSAIFYYQQLISLKEQSTDQAGLLSDYSMLGGLHSELGNYKNAQATFIKATQYSESQQDTFSQVTIYIEMANVYLEERLPTLALEHVEKAYTLAQSKGMLMSAGQCLELEGNILEQQNEPAQAVDKYQEAMLVYQQLGLTWQSANLLVKIAAISNDSAALIQAENALYKVIDQRIAAGDKLGLLDAKILLCDVLLKQHKSYQQVTQWLEECQRWAMETQNTNALKRVYLLKSILKEKTGQYAAALQFFKQYTIIQDSLLALENIREVRRLEKQYETVTKDKEIAEQQIILEKQSNSLQAKKTQISILLISLFFTVALTILIGFIYRRNRQLNMQKLNVMQKERETEMLRAMITGEEQERIRIARDLHDNLGAMMATVKMRVSALANHLPSINELEGFKKTEELLDDAYVIVREFSHNMIPGALRKYGLEQAIENLCEAIETAHDINIEFISFGLDELDNDVVETNVYQVVQELLQNVSKHAKASEVIVQLIHEDDSLQVVVEDDGKGFNTKNIAIQRGMGIENIRSRVNIMKGKLEVYSIPKEGSTFSIFIPLGQNP